MKSSSEFFPVSLLKADILGDLTDDVYLIKHNRDADDTGVEIALSHLGIYGQTFKGKQPVILVHGSFTNRGFWLSSQGIGLARYLVENNYDVWLMEMRGHGFSPRNQGYRHNSIESYVQFDVPAINDFVIEKTGLKPVWLGHSLGGVMISTALAAGLLPENKVSGAVFLGTQVVRRRGYFYIPFAAVLARCVFLFKKEMDGRKLRVGPENEPAGIAKEYLRWFSLLGGWRLRSTKVSLLVRWKELTLPVLSMVGESDKSDPAKYCYRFFQACGSTKKTFSLLSKEEGFSKSYGHIDMIVSKDAAVEVWPKIKQWLDDVASSSK